MVEALVDGDALGSFRGRFAGRVVTPDDADYDEVRGSVRMERRHRPTSLGYRGGHLGG